MVSMSTPWKHPDTGVYYLRKGIPKDVRHVFSGKTVFKKSLGTKDAKKAKALFLNELQRVESLLAMAVNGTIQYSPKQAKGLAGMWLQKALDEDEAYRDTKGTPEGDTKK